jgi:hypothetical protein
MLELRVATRLAALWIDLDIMTDASDLIGCILDVVVAKAAAARPLRMCSQATPSAVGLFAGGTPLGSPAHC